MFPVMLMQLIERHADVLAEGLVRKLKNSDRCRELVRRVPGEELKKRSQEIYQHISDWLVSKTESEIEERFIGIGFRRARQGVPFSELLWTINTVKEHLWDYLEQEGLLEQPVDLYGDREMLQSLEQFFDRALYFAAIGYENAGHGQMEHSCEAPPTRAARG